MCRGRPLPRRRNRPLDGQSFLIKSRRNLISSIRRSTDLDRAGLPPLSRPVRDRSLGHRWHSGSSRLSSSLLGRCNTRSPFDSTRTCRAGAGNPGPVHTGRKGERRVLRHLAAGDDKIAEGYRLLHPGPSDNHPLGPTEMKLATLRRRCYPGRRVDCVTPRSARIGGVVELVLTAERQEELAALLDDEQRLLTEYPKVSEYLGMAPRLAGTGDLQTDSAFDLRFVHYVTGGLTESSNPYWDIVAPFVFEQGRRRVVNGGRPDGSVRLAYAQTLLQAMYAYGIPSPETLEWAADFCGDRQVLELGAGRGYWAAQLTRSGLRVEAYDSEPPGKVTNVSFPGAAGQVDAWHPVGDLTEFAGNARNRSDDVLFLCWPPGWGDTMASDALVEFKRLDGNRLVYIGEERGGKTGDDAFFDALAAEWELVTQDARYVAWWNLKDVAQGWIRR
jgi:hypothetical protein